MKKVNLHKKAIEEFISRRFPLDCNWTNGNCFYFALILSTAFPELEICYLPISGHFVASNDYNCYYDYNGYHDAEEKMIPLEYIKKTDNKLYEALIRDCIK